jgi:hypothetical protein
MTPVSTIQFSVMRTSACGVDCGGICYCCLPSGVMALSSLTGCCCMLVRWYKMWVMWGWHVSWGQSNPRTASANPTVWLPTTSSGLVWCLDLGWLGIQSYENPNDGRGVSLWTNMQLVAQEDSIADFNTSWSLGRWSLVTGHINVGHGDICLCHQGMIWGFHSKLISWVAKSSLSHNVFNY